MISALDGQLDIFDALEVPKPVPPFTVIHGYGPGWKRSCGWCGTTNTIGGGACRMPGDPSKGIHYDYCQPCATRYGSPRVWIGGTPLFVKEAR